MHRKKQFDSLDIPSDDRKIVPEYTGHENIAGIRSNSKAVVKGKCEKEQVTGKAPATCSSFYSLFKNLWHL